MCYYIDEKNFQGRYSMKLKRIFAAVLAAAMLLSLSLIHISEPTRP